MGMKTTTISARISTTTKDDVEEFLRSRGLQRDRFMEDALRHYLRFLRSAAEESRISSSMVFTNQSFEEILHSIQNPRKPTSQLTKLMRGDLSPREGL